MQRDGSKYLKTIRSSSGESIQVDIYDVINAWRDTCKNPALQHLVKKALQPGARGHKDCQRDMKDIVESALRAYELETGTSYFEEKNND